jgi:hypothetical protein
MSQHTDTPTDTPTDTDTRTIAAPRAGSNGDTVEPDEHPEPDEQREPVEHGELIAPPDDAGEPPHNSITEPAKVMRIGSMVKQLLEEVRLAPLDDASRERLAEIYDRSVVELSEALSPDLQEELRMLTLPFDHDGVPSDSELRVAKAQLVGWLEGLFHGIQASLVAQQMAARHQLEQMRQLNAGQGEDPSRPGHLPPQIDRPGTYI